jgi:hypothetical protein
MSAKSPCLLNRNIQYSDGFILGTGFIYRPLSSAEGLGLSGGIDASTYALYFAFFTRPVENAPNAVVRQACYLL